MKISKQRILSCIAAASITLLFACGDDKSSSPNTDTDLIPSSASVLDSINNPGIPGSSAVENISSDSSTDPLAQSSESTQPSTDLTDGSSTSSAEVSGNNPRFREPTAEEIAQDRQFVALSNDTDFVDLKTVYESLAPDEKVVFVIRHARRQSSTGKESELTPEGVEQAQRLGGFLANEETFSYGHTGFLRTLQTAQNIAIGRGETFPEPVEVTELVTGSYIADTTRFRTKMDELHYFDEACMYSEWAFDGLHTDVFYDFEKTSVQIITQAILPRMSETNRVNIFVSHDMFLGPLVAYTSNKKMQMLRQTCSSETGKSANSRWIFYLEGVAIIVKPNGDRRYIPVSGIEYRS